MLDALKLLTIANGPGKISGAVHAIISKQHQKISNALEMLELSIPREIFQKINRLAEHKQRRQHSRSENKTIASVLKEIIESKMIHYNDWTRAVAIKMAAGLKSEELHLFLKDQNFSLSPILNETRTFILSQPKN